MIEIDPDLETYFEYQPKDGKDVVASRNFRLNLKTLTTLPVVVFLADCVSHRVLRRQRESGVDPGKPRQTLQQ